MSVDSHGNHAAPHHPVEHRSSVAHVQRHLSAVMVLARQRSGLDRPLPHDGGYDGPTRSFDGGASANLGLGLASGTLAGP